MIFSNEYLKNLTEYGFMIYEFPDFQLIHCLTVHRKCEFAKYSVLCDMLKFITVSSLIASRNC